jgi:hypothetical protein
MKWLLIVGLAGCAFCARANYVSVSCARRNTLCAGRNR